MPPATDKRHIRNANDTPTLQVSNGEMPKRRHSARTMSSRTLGHTASKMLRGKIHIRGNGKGKASPRCRAARAAAALIYITHMYAPPYNRQQKRAHGRAVRRHVRIVCALHANEGRIRRWHSRRLRCRERSIRQWQKGSAAPATKSARSDTW